MAENQVVKNSPTMRGLVDNDKNTQLHYYAARGQIEEFKKTYKKHENIDVENYLGWTPLMMACRNGHLDMVKTLLDLDADATKSNKFGYSVFLISVSGGNRDIVVLILQRLLRGGISRNTLQQFLSPMSLAILFGHNEIFQYLLTQNFNLNARTPFTGLTPLMFAAGMEDSSAFIALLNKNADADIKNFLGLTARDIQDSKRITNSKNSKPSAPAEVVKNPQISPYPHPIPQIVCNNGGYPNFLCVTPHLRRSSNMLTPSPNIYFTFSNISPISAVPYSPQIFFPPDFTIPQYYPISPVPIPSYPDEVFEDPNSKSGDHCQ